MSDIVKGWREYLESLGNVPMSPSENYAEEMADEIESLRQQVEQWKSSYLEQVELHNKTLDELRETERRLTSGVQVAAESRSPGT